VREAFPDATILRPGPLFGHEDRTITNWAAAVRNWPFVPVFRPHAEFNPLSVRPPDRYCHATHTRSRRGIHAHAHSLCLLDRRSETWPLP